MKNAKEIMLGLIYGIITVLFMLGILPWEMFTKIFACIVAMAAIFRIRKKMNLGQKPTAFTISYVAVLALSTVLLS